MIRPSVAAGVLLSTVILAAPLAQQDAPVTTRGEWTTDARHGWSSDNEPRVQINLRSGDGNNWGFGVPAAELEGLPAAAPSGTANDVRFTWTREAFESRMQGSAIRRIGYERWLRNIAVALGNAPPDAKIVDALHNRADDASSLVREHVAWAIDRQQRGLAQLVGA